MMAEIIYKPLPKILGTAKLHPNFQLYFTCDICKHWRTWIPLDHEIVTKGTGVYPCEACGQKHWFEFWPFGPGPEDGWSLNHEVLRPTRMVLLRET